MKEAFFFFQKKKKKEKKKIWRKEKKKKKEETIQVTVAFGNRVLQNVGGRTNTFLEKLY